MSDIEERITALTQRYYELVNRDHHKDRDCHFYILKDWTYGDAPVYKVEHQGYINEWDGPDKFPDSTSAHWALLKFLEGIVKDQEEFDPDAAWTATGATR